MYHFPYCRLMDNAKEMIAESLPIKCLEAVILSLYLTIPLTCVQRFTISFKSHFSRLYYRHVVLGVTNGTTYGALGLSRRADLMYKPFEYQVCMKNLYIITVNLILKCPLSSSMFRGQNYIPQTPELVYTIHPKRTIH